MGNAQIENGQKLMLDQIDGDRFKNQKPLYNVQDIKFPLSTYKDRIVDATGRRVKLAGGNLSGAHMRRHCIDGLECQSLKEIALYIRYKFKMNCIRLTYSLQMYYDKTPVPEKYLKANRDLIGKTSMQIFDITVKTLTDVGLMVILNNHTSTSQWCCSNDDGDGLWWSRKYPQYKFFQNCQQFARRYSRNPRVIGMDLRNQLRKAHGRDATWGDGNPLTDWKRAAQICGEKVLKIAPHWLILVSGVNYQLDLTGVQKTGIQYSVPNKLVYTGHFYGFSWPIPSWKLVSYDSFKEKMFKSQTFVRALGYPYFLGEYGNNCRDIPWQYLIRYLKQTDIDWTYWALDGFKCEKQTDQTYGVFNNDFDGCRHEDLLQDMISVGPPPGTVIEPPKGVRVGAFNSSKKNQQCAIQKPRPYQRKLEPLVQSKLNSGTTNTNISNISNNSNSSIINNTGNIEPKFLTSTNYSQPQFVQQTRYIEQPQQQLINQKMTSLIEPNQAQQVPFSAYNSGFKGTRQTQPMMSQSIKASRPIEIRNSQHYNPQFQFVANQPIQQNTPNQQYPQPQRPIFFDSNGRPILR